MPGGTRYFRGERAPGRRPLPREASVHEERSKGGCAVVNKLSRASWVVACTLAVLFCLGGAQIASAATLQPTPFEKPQTVIITDDGDEYYPDGIRLRGTAITYPGAEELAAKYSSYDGSEWALCASS